MSIETPKVMGRPSVGARRITVTVSEETFRWVEHVARSSGISTAAVLRNLIEMGREATEGKEV